MTLQIRPEGADDFESIRIVVAAAFKSDAEADLVDRIRESPEYIPELSLVADDDGEIVGHVLTTWAHRSSRSKATRATTADSGSNPQPRTASACTCPTGRHRKRRRSSR